MNLRLSQISSSKAIFDDKKGPYQEALRQAGYSHELEYKASDPKPKGRRSRNVIYFLPPYSLNVESDVGGKFLRLVSKCFPKKHKLHKVFNKNNLKITYRTMPNIKAILSSHNKGVLQKKTEPQTKPCNCRVKATCPTNGDCRKSGVIYRATVKGTDKDPVESYVGITSGEFKQRYTSHLASFKHSSKRSETTLSKHVWELRDRGVVPLVTWELIGHAPPYQPGRGNCALCLQEKYIIMYYKNLASLNSRTEVANTCRHRAKFLLSNG